MVAMSLRCSVPQCSSHYSKELDFHKFPDKPATRAKWEAVLRMPTPQSKYARICGLHFTPRDYFPQRPSTKVHRLFPHAVPSQNLPVRSHDKVLTPFQKNLNEARRKRASERQYQKEIKVQLEERSVCCESVLEEEEEDDLDVPLQSLKKLEQVRWHKSTQANLAPLRAPCNNEESHSLADLLTENSRDKTCQVNFLATAPVLERKVEKVRTSFVNILDTDEKLFTFTGIGSLDLLEGLVKCAGDLIFVSQTKQKSISTKEIIVLVMVKIKLNLSFTELGVLFNVTRTSASNYFREMCPILTTILKAVVPLPDPKSLLGSFGNVEGTSNRLNCAERVVKRRNDDVNQTAELPKAKFDFKKVTQHISEFQLFKRPASREMVPLFDDCLCIVSGIISLCNIRKT